MIITKQAEEYIRLQRTGYGNADLVKCYEKDIQKDFDSIKKHLPIQDVRIMDVGCGIGGIDLYIYNYYISLDKKAEINLLDFSKKTEIYYGYKERASAYNHLALSKQFLTLNGVNKKDIALHDAEKGYPHKFADVIISLLSCGFHYPIDTYLEAFKKFKAGIIILDIRKNSGQVQKLIDNFHSVQVIAEYSKCERVLIK